MTRVEIEHVDRRYGALHVLKDVSLTVEEGEFVVLLGPSGCGKSTLLSSIAGLDPLQGGRILFDGEDVGRLDPSARNIGMVFQNYALYPSMRVRGNLSFGLESQGVPRARIRERVDWAAGLLQIDGLLDRRPSALSGGQRQRVAIGRALVRETGLFLFDEPLSNLDAKLRTEMRVEIKALHQRLGATFIYVTHDQVEAMTLATRIAVMNGGRIEQYAPPDEIYERPAALFVADFIGSPPMNLLPATVEDGAVLIEGTGVRLRIPSALASAAPTGVMVGLRPEALALQDGGAIAGPLLVREPLGSDTLIWIELGPHRVVARLTPDEARGLGERVALAAPPEALSLFDRQTGRRVEA